MENFLHYCLVVSTLFATINGLKCQLGDGIATYGSFDCSDASIFGETHNKCQVFIQTNGKTQTINRGCLSKSVPLSVCGNTVHYNGTTIQSCCCDTDNCNDEALMKACQKSNIPEQPKGRNDLRCNFKVMTDGFLAGPAADLKCSNKLYGDYIEKCMVMLTDSPYSGKMVQHGCVPKGKDEDKCGTSITLNGGTTVKTCCCYGNQCNDDSFATKCKGMPNPSR